MSRQGRKDGSAVPAGLGWFVHIVIPALKRWAIVRILPRQVAHHEAAPGLPQRFALPYPVTIPHKLRFSFNW